MTSEGRLVYSIRGLLLKKLTSRGSRHVNGEDSSLRLPMIPRSDKTIRQEPLIKYFNSPLIFFRILGDLTYHRDKPP